jgi:hypothetical protein
MKAVAHGVAMLALVAATALCVLVQVDHVDDALDVISSRAAVVK